MVVLMLSVIRFDMSRNNVEICVCIWFGVSVCIVVVEVGIGNDVKNIVMISIVSDVGRLLSCVNSVVGIVMYVVLIVLVCIGVLL